MTTGGPNLGIMVGFHRTTPLLGFRNNIGIAVCHLVAYTFHLRTRAAEASGSLIEASSIYIASSRPASLQRDHVSKEKNTTIGSTRTSTKNRIPQHFSLTRKMGGWQGEEQCSGCPQLHTPVILALQRLRQEDSCEFKARLDYTGYQDSPLYRIRAAINPPWFWAACGGSPVFPAFDIVKEDWAEFEASLGHTVRPCVLRKKRHPCSFIMWL